jgi:hypothetical protein
MVTLACMGVLTAFAQARPRRTFRFVFVFHPSFGVNI